MDQQVGCIVNGMHMADQPYLRSCDIGRGIIETNRKGSVRTRSAEQKRTDPLRALYRVIPSSKVVAEALLATPF